MGGGENRAEWTSDREGVVVVILLLVVGLARGCASPHPPCEPVHEGVATRMGK